MQANRLASVAVSILLLLPAGGLAQGRAYDPSAVEAASRPAIVDLTVRDDARQRDIPIRAYLPAATKPAPVVLFSPGLGGSREGYVYLGEHWARRGYVVVVLQHPGSDDAVWRDAPVESRLAALREAASIQNFLQRVKDVAAVLDRLEAWNRDPGGALAGRLELGSVGMAGHSFGAVTTQAVSGESLGLGGTRYTDARIKAAIAMSPSSPSSGNPQRAFARVAIPWLLMTGTRDVAPIGDVDVASRLAVYEALPPHAKYELVLDGAEHSAFSDRALPGDQGRDPNQHRAILALSTAFWDSYLRGDAAARAWLDGSGARSVLEKADRWRSK